jgi:hypothetical protein
VKREVAGIEEDNGALSEMCRQGLPGKVFMSQTIIQYLSGPFFGPTIQFAVS